jgi:transposase
MDIRPMLMQLEVGERFIAEIEAEMRPTLERIPFIGRLLSIKGLGIVSVAGLIGAVGDFSKFHTQSEIMKLAGLDLYEISSGKRTEKDIQEGERPSEEDSVLCSNPNDPKEWDHV